MAHQTHPVEQEGASMAVTHQEEHQHQGRINMQTLLGPSPGSEETWVKDHDQHGLTAFTPYGMGLLLCQGVKGQASVVSWVSCSVCDVSGSLDVSDLCPGKQSANISPHSSAGGSPHRLHALLFHQAERVSSTVRLFQEVNHFDHIQRSTV